MYLNVRSYYSFKFGTLSIRNLLEAASRQGVKRMAITDINSTAGIIEFFREAPKFGIAPVAGVEFRNQHLTLYIALAQNIHGMEEINRFLSAHLQQNLPFPEKAPEFSHVRVIYPYRRNMSTVLRPWEYVGIKPEDLLRFRLDGTTRILTKQLTALLTVTISGPDEFRLHRLLRAIHLNTLHSKLPPESICHPEEQFRSMEEWKKRFGTDDFLLRNAEELLESCTLDFRFGVPKNRIRFTGCEREDFHLLQTLTLKGARERYGHLTPELTARLEKELDIIRKKNFIAYFLINWDIVNFAQSRGYFYVGRGSGANSMAAYCLRITDVDPVELDLYFERFINLYRESPPDFDLDFSWKDRDEVQAYIFRRHGTERVCLMGTVSTFQTAAAVRELSKTAGLPKEETETLLNTLGNGKPKDKITAAITHYARMMQDFPSHISIHAGGVLISEEPIYRYTAPLLPPKGFPVSQFDMYVAEDLGLYKYDILSQRGLGHIKDAVELIRINRGKTVDIQAIQAFKKDEKVCDMLRLGDCMGCFYIESPAMRGLLRKLECADYPTLVAASSIIRPGVASSGMMREYILRHRDPEARKQAHPVMAEIMPDTYGVMVYQEDVIRVAHQFGGLSPAEADVLRRGMSGKFRSREEFQRVKDQFFQNCREQGRPEELTSEVWRQIESFAGYSFAKGHSASYAVESFQSLYLKAHYPLEFITAVINNFGGFFRTEFYFHEARRAGGNVEMPCINHSEYLTTLNGNTLWMGFIHVGRLEKKTSDVLIREREKNGPYQNLEDFLNRTAIQQEQLMLLVRAGAFRFMGKPKAHLLWEAHFLSRGKKEKNGAELFRKPEALTHPLPDMPISDKVELSNQLEIFGFPSQDPFRFTDNLPPERVKAADYAKNKGKTITSVGYLVTVKPTRTIKGDRMYFGTFTDEDGQWIDTVHFPESADRYPFRGSGVYVLRGKITDDFGVPSLEVHHMEKRPYEGIR